MLHSLTIGQLSRETHCKVPTIRYYEAIGLMPPPPRTSGNQRRYGQEHLARLGFIQHSRKLGFSQNAIRDLLALTEQPNQCCETVTEIARKNLNDVNRRIAQLMTLKVELERMIEVCHGGQIADCRIIEKLASHPHKPSVASK